MKYFVFVVISVTFLVSATKTGATPNPRVSETEGFIQQLYNWIAESDACVPNPCLNGGTCRPTEDGTFKCDCPPGYTGDTCETNVCTPGFCKNGGNCLPDDQGNATCNCDHTGFVGPHCEQEDKCTEEKNLCVHGVCSNVANENGYYCDCEQGYVGVNCDKEDACKPPNGDPIDCKNDGWCVPDGSKDGWQCFCKADYYGKYCETADPCKIPTNPCYNGGICSFDANFTVSCECLPEWMGDFCEDERICNPPCNTDHGVCGTDPKNQTNLVCYCQSGYIGDSCDEYVCDEFLCYNGASCIVDQFGQAECDCPPGYEGVHCDINECYPDNTSYCHNGGICEIDQNTGTPNCKCPSDELLPPQCDFPHYSLSDILF